MIFIILTWQRAHRKEETGCLVVDRVLAGSPAEGCVDAGDILLAVDRTTCSHFVQLEASLDDCIGSFVELTLCRRGQARDTTAKQGAWV
eukprot:m.350629 g.350629  ORF g.350629 m.350629 type:complete len:89 (+) comp19890_c0_seq4:1211-1477(+)